MLITTFTTLVADFLVNYYPEMSSQSIAYSPPSTSWASRRPSNPATTHSSPHGHCQSCSCQTTQSVASSQCSSNGAPILPHYLSHPVRESSSTNHPCSSRPRTQKHANGRVFSDTKASYALIGGESPNSTALATGIVIRHGPTTTLQPPDLKSNIQPLRPRRRTNPTIPLFSVSEATLATETRPKSLYILSPTSPLSEPASISAQRGMNFSTNSSSSSSHSPSDVTITLEHPPPPYADSDTSITPHGSSITTVSVTPSVITGSDINFAPRRHSVASESHSAWGWVKNHLSRPIDRSSPIFGRPLHVVLAIAGEEVPIMVPNRSVVYARVPLLVTKCGFWLKAHGLYEVGIFHRDSPWTTSVKKLRAEFERLPDYGRILNMKGRYTPSNAADVLRQFLSELPEPVIPYSQYDEFVAILDEPRELAIDRTKQALKIMDKDSRELLLYLLDLMITFAMHGPEAAWHSSGPERPTNMTTIGDLVRTFKPLMLSHPRRDWRENEDQRARHALMFLVENRDTLLHDRHSWQ